VWQLRSVQSAAITDMVRDDGRRCITVRHAELKGVTPEMLVWWYGHVDGDMQYAGQRWSRHLRGRKWRHRIPNGS